MSNSSITAIEQDTLGFMWVGTKDGLLQFDGYRFKLFKHEAGDSSSLSGNEITDIQKTKDGKLWVATMYNGISVYDPWHSEFKVIKNITDDLYSLSNNSVVALAYDGEYIWAATYFGLNRIDAETYEVKRFFTDFTVRFTPEISAKIFEAGVPRNTVLKISTLDGTYFRSIIAMEAKCIDLLGTVAFEKLKHFLFPWGTLRFNRADDKKQVFSDVIFVNDSLRYVSGINGGIYKINMYDGSLQDILEANHADISGMKQIGNELFALCFNGKLLCIDLQTKSTKSFQLDDEERLVSVDKRQDGKLLLSTERRLYLVACGSDDAVPVSFSEAIGLSQRGVWPYSLPPVITCSFVDNQKNKWYGTESGLFLIERRKKFTRHYPSAHLNAGLRMSAIASLAVDQDDNLWVGYFDALIDVFDADSMKRVKHFWTNDDHVTFGLGTPQCIEKYGASHMLVGSYQGGLHMYNASDGRFRLIALDSLDVNHQKKHDVRDIALDIDKHAWLALNGGGLCRVDLQSGELLRLRADYVQWKNRLHHDWLQTVFCDSKGNVWASSAEGLSRLNTNDFSIESFRGTGSEIGMLSTVLNCMFEDKHGVLWTGTNDGLFKYIPGKKKFDLVLGAEQINSCQIMSIIEDGGGRLWLATKQGLVSYNPSTGKRKQYSVYDGIHTDDFALGLAAKMGDGKIYIGAKNGLTSFYPDEIEEFENNAQIVFTGLETYSTDSLQKRIVHRLDKNISTAHRISIPYQRSVLRFEFAMLNFGQSKENVYSYLLEGLENEWHFIGHKNEISFSDLSPGRYTLKIKAANGNKIWTKNAASLTFNILPVWWQTYYFKAFVVLLMGVFMYLLVRYRFQKIEKQKLYLAQEVRKRTADLTVANQNMKQQKAEIVQQSEELIQKNKQLEKLNKTKDKLFYVVSHDMKSPLATLMGYVDLLKRSGGRLTEQKRDLYIESIDDVANKLYALLMNLLDWSRSQSGKIAFRPENVNVRGLLQDVVGLYEPMAEKKHIQLLINQSADLHVYADMQMLSSILRNIVSNALKFTYAYGTVAVTAKNNADGTLMLKIADSGVGMTEEQVENAFTVKSGSASYGTNNEEGTGLGMLICKEFIDIHNGTIQIKSALGVGSVLVVLLPLHNDSQ